MRKFFTILFLPILLIACSQESKMKSEVKRYLQAELNDPNSYEPISFSFSQVTMKNEELVWEEFIDKEHEENKQNALNMIEQVKNSNYSQKSKDRIINLENEYLKLIEIVYASQKSQINKNAPKSSTLTDCKHVFRAKNAMGALMKNSYTFRFDENLNIQNIKQENISSQE